MSIRRLPEDAVDKLKSSVTITSLNEVIVGLLKNSLDASASSIRITLSYAKGDCSVVDDGHGIPPSEFLEDGGLGKLHRE
jgi:DNA mismatch repair protein MLH3